METAASIFAVMALLLVVTFGGIVAVAIWGWIAIPVQRRFPVSFGVPPSVEGTVGKRAGLGLFLLIGAWLFVTSLFAASEGMQIGWIGVGVLAFFLAIEYRLVRRLAR